MDPLLLMGVLVLGAAVGSVLTYARFRGVINWDRKARRGTITDPPPEPQTEEMFGFGISKWTVLKTSAASNARLVGRAVAQADGTFGTKAGLAPLSTDTLPSELHRGRKAAR